MKQFCTSVLFLLSCALAALAQTPRQTPYTWKNVQIVGGGFVDGVIFHPTAPGVRYARTDMGGAYRWNPQANRWKPILDWMPYKDLNLMGVESIAVDPNDPRRVYLSCGTYTDAKTPDGAILRSEDGGVTFKRANVPIKFGGNEDGRGNGERLVVDPRDSRILFLGTRHNGLWRSEDRGATWARVSTFPDVTEPLQPMPVHLPGETPGEYWMRIPIRGSGVVFVKFGPPTNAKGAKTASQTIYAGVSLMNRPNLFVSRDGGVTWNPIPGEPTAYRPTRAALSSDGFLYVTYGTAPGPMPMKDGAVWKLDTHTGQWTDITPDHPVKGKKEFGYAAVSVDSSHPQTLIASTFGRPWTAGSDDIFRSIDGGATWKPIFGGGGTYDYSGAPYVRKTPIHWLFDIEIDPLNPDHAVFTTGYGGWETFDLTAADQGKPTHWSALATGIEETVALELNSPAAGPHLLTAIGDYGGFVHWDLDRPAPEGSSAPPRFGNTTGVTSATLRPEVIVRVGDNAENKPGQSLGYSLDSGRTWKASVTTPRADSRAGSVAVSADGSVWIWTPEHESSYLTRDQGATWTAVQGLPANLRVIADPKDSSRFYALAFRGKTLYRSVDGGATFAAERLTLPAAEPKPAGFGRGDDRGGQDRIYAAPGHSGDLWLAAFDGLYHALPFTTPATATSFVRLPGVEELHAFGFGKAAPGKVYPTLYMVGTVHGQRGIFRSTDEARTWVRINDDRHQWGLVLQITGDPKLYGRVYVGTHGRGVSYGDPVVASGKQ